MTKDNPEIMRLVVMRLADMHRRHPRQDNSRVCSLCRWQVGIFPTGQAALANFPEIPIVCQVCVLEKVPDAEVAVVLAPGGVEDIAREVRESYPVDS